MKLLNELRNIDYKISGTFHPLRELIGSPNEYLNNIIIKYKKNITYYPINYVLKTTDYYDSSVNDIVGKLLRKKIYINNSYLGSLLKSFNFEFPGKDKITTKEYDLIIKEIKKELLTIPNDTENIVSNFYNSSLTSNVLIKNINLGELIKINNYFSSALMLGECKKNNIVVNDCFNIGSIINKKHSLYDGTPLVYFAVHKDYIPTLKMLFLFNKMNNIDYTKIRLIIDETVMVRGTPHRIVRNTVNKFLLPICKTLNIETITLNVKEDVLDKDLGFGYGVDKFKTFCDTHSEEISLVFNSGNKYNISTKGYFNY